MDLLVAGRRNNYRDGDELRSDLLSCRRAVSSALSFETSRMRLSPFASCRPRVHGYLAAVGQRWRDDQSRADEERERFDRDVEVTFQPPDLLTDRRDNSIVRWSFQLRSRTTTQRR
jgi:hypothetical protein